MPRRIPTPALALALFGVLLGALLFAGCGSEEEGLTAVEGEPLDINELVYNVQITRLLNEAAIDDSEYLKGLPEPPTGSDYLAVFIRIDNDGAEPQRIPDNFPIETSRGQVFEPIETDSPFALQLGAEIPPDGQLPAVDSAAFSGPIKGSMLLYLVEAVATEARPLELQIAAPDGEIGAIELDI